MRQLGQFLVNKNVISQEELDTIIEKHSQLSSGLPDILFSEGYVNPYNLYQAIAEFYGMEFADLQKIPCDINLLNINERETYKSLQLMPWKTANGKIAIAVCDINTEVKNWAESKYSDYYFVITSPFDIHASINYAFAKQNDIDAREMLLRMHPMYSASNLFSGIQSKIFLIGVLVLLAFFAFFPKISLPILFLAVTFFYISTLAFKFILFLIGGLKGKQVSREQKYLKVPDKDLPIYTILVPLYKEDKTLKKLTTAIKNLDYPKSRLDVKLIVEADDEITISAIKALKCERMFEMVKVPYSIPRTKPKACNYALRFARGEYVTIYDAEDIPEPLQLKKALYTFYNSPEVVACVQAKLGNGYPNPTRRY
ncbi:MAG: N-glycosyltransferase [Rickettsiaceae bacterium]|nr:N-glycosyltransferase [Rickettsiaceae bacterium]